MSMRKAYEILILANRCKECGLCISICPTKVLEVGSKPNEKGYLATIPSKPSKCIGCKLCEYICPDYVIIVKEDGGGKSIGRVIWSEDEVDTYES